MSSVDDRIVQMRFENSAFQRGVSTTMGALAKLKASLNFSRSTESMNELQDTANQFNMGGMDNAVQGISGRFVALSTVAITALANITNRAVDAGLRIGRALTIDPVKAGFQEYETGLNSVQTILANTQAAGTDLKDVNATLLELNHYADQTIYNFGEMARNIGTFTAAGVDLETSTASIKGIANLAALSGSNSQQASTAMYQLSQAIAAGKVSLMDWNSVVNAGMGGSVFQRSLAETAVAMGTLDKGALKLDGTMKNVKINGASFRDSISAENGESWLTSEVLTTALSTFTGDLTEAELAAQGFTAEQVKAIQETAKTAKSAATEVKSMTQLWDTLKESVSSGWAQTWQMIFGDFEEAKQLFTGISNALGGMVGKMAESRNNLIFGWKELGGRDALISGLRDSFDAVYYVIKQVGLAFRDIFPATSVATLVSMTERFAAFASNLKMGEETANNLRRTFRGVFAVFSIVWQVTKGVAGVFFDLAGVISQGTGGVLEFTGGIGDFLVAIDAALKEGGKLERFFDGLSAFLSAPLSLLVALSDAIFGAASNMDELTSSGINGFLERLQSRFQALGGAGEFFIGIWERIQPVFEEIRTALQPLIDSISETFAQIGPAIANAMNAGTFDSALDALNVGLLGGIVILLRRFFSNGFNIDFGNGFLEGLNDTFEGLTGTLSAMQAQLQAKTLITIATAIALITVSLIGLSLLDSEALTRSLTAMSVGMAQLLIAMAILTKISGMGGFVKIPLIATSMVILATSLLILTASLHSIAALSWEELGKGMAGLAGMLILLSGAVAVMSSNSGGMVRVGIGLIGIAIALKLMVSVMKDFNQLDWQEFGKGIAGIASVLGVLAVAMRAMPKGMVAQAAALLILGGALKLMASALKDFGNISWDVFARGIATLSAMLGTLAVTMRLMPKNMIGQAIALGILGGSLHILSSALKTLADMSWKDFGKSMAVLSGSLAIIAIGLRVMTGTLSGSAALLVAAAALAVLSPVLQDLGKMSLEEIGKGLLVLAGVFTVLGLAGLILAPLVPVILGLGIAVAAIGAGVFLAGTGILFMATALTMLTAAGTAAVAIMVLMLESVLNLIPVALQRFGEGIVAFAGAIAQGAPAFTAAFTALLISLLNAIIQTTPKIGEAFSVLLQTALKVIRDNIPAIIQTGFSMLLALLNGIKNNIGQVVTTVAQIIVEFIDGIAANIGDIIQSGFDLLVAFLDGIADGIENNSSRIIDAGVDIAQAIVDGIVQGLEDLGGSAIQGAKDLAGDMLDGAMNVLGINSPSREFRKIGRGVVEGMALGVQDDASNAVDAVTDMGVVMLSTMQNTMSQLGDVAVGAIDIDPTITPVFDLTKLQSDATRISGFLNTNPISVGGAYSSAAAISRAQQTAAEARAAEAAVNSAQPNVFKLTQNNYSPKALDSATIYRNGKSLIATVKGALDKG